MMTTKMKSGVYLITNKVNDRKYVGSTINIIRRQQTHFSSLRVGIHGNPYLQNDFNKCGESNFIYTILELNVNFIPLLRQKP